MTWSGRTGTIADMRSRLPALVLISCLLVAQPADAVSLDSNTTACLVKSVGNAATSKILKAKKLSAAQQRAISKCKSGAASTTNTTVARASSTRCSGDSVFKRLPVELSKISYVAPVGVLAPVGGSPLPKRHTGMMLTENGVPLYAPGNLTITQIRKVTYKVSPTRPGYIDYALFYSVCDEVSGHFGHITNLNETLQPQRRRTNAPPTAPSTRRSNLAPPTRRSALPKESELRRMEPSTCPRQ